MINILSNPPTIETSRLTLRPLTMADDEAVFSYASDPEVTKYVLFGIHQTTKIAAPGCKRC
jgi:ribosomal-protein-alanine N-acetyltransferase